MQGKQSLKRANTPTVRSRDAAAPSFIAYQEGDYCLKLGDIERAERLLRADIAIGDLARQVQHQLNALRAQNPVEIQWEVACRAALARLIAGNLFVRGIGRVHETGVLPQRQHKVLCTDGLKLRS